HGAAAERAGAAIRDRVALRCLVEAAHAADVARVDIDVSRCGIDGDAAEVRTALLPGKKNAELAAAVRRVRPEVVDAAEFLDELATELLVRRFTFENLVGRDAQT